MSSNTEDIDTISDGLGRTAISDDMTLEKRLDNLLATAQEETADIDLFAPIPDKKECPICMIPVPVNDSEITFMSCCGKSICNGCIYKHMMNNRMNKIPVNQQTGEQPKRETNH